MIFFVGDDNFTRLYLNNSPSGNHRELVVISDGVTSTLPCNLNDISMFSWTYTCLTIGYQDTDNDTLVTKVSKRKNKDF